MPAIYDELPTREHTAQYVDVDKVINQITIRGMTNIVNIIW